LNFRDDGLNDDMYFRVTKENSRAQREINTYSKLDAVFHSNDVSKIEFVYNEEEYGRIQTSLEPKETIDELYAKRARQLRETYDHIVVMYSGGIDSTNVLHTFFDNNLEVDEVCTWLFTDIESDKNALANREASNKALPYMQYLKDIGKIKKATIVEIGQLIIEQFNDQTIAENFAWILNGIANPWILAVRSSPLFKQKFFSHHDELIRQGKKIGFIWGFDKCQMMFNKEQQTYQMYFSDAAFDLQQQRLMFQKFMDRDVLTLSIDEPFYFSKLHPDITLKQCHLVAKAAENIPSDSPDLHNTLEDVPTTGPFIQHHSGKYLKKKVVDRIIYPKQDVSLFGDDKVKASMIISPKMAWFFKYKDREGKNLFLDRVKFLMQKFPAFYIYKNGLPWTTKYFFTKKYPIRKISNNA
jgi:hypothetical protein